MGEMVDSEVEAIILRKAPIEVRMREVDLEEAAEEEAADDAKSTVE